MDTAQLINKILASRWVTTFLDAESRKAMSLFTLAAVAGVMQVLSVKIPP